MRSIGIALACVLALTMLCAADQPRDTSRLEVMARILAAEDSLHYEPFLAEVLLNPQSTEMERGMAARAIGHIGDLQGVEPLLQALKKDFSRRDHICEALGWLWANSPEQVFHPEPPASVLAALLASAAPDRPIGDRIAAFEALALAFPRDGLKEAAQTAVELSRIHGDPSTVELFRAIVRVAGAERKYQSPAVDDAKERLTIFEHALAQPDAVVVYQAVYFAGRSPAFDLPLTRQLVKTLDRPESWVRARVLLAITAREKEAPAGVVDRAKKMLAEGSTQEKIAAAHALAKFLPPADAFAVLKDALDHASTARATTAQQALIEALAAVKDPGVAAYLWGVGRRKVPCWRIARIAAAAIVPQAQVVAEPIDHYTADDEYALMYVALLQAARATDKLNWLISGEGVPERFVRSLVVRQAIVLALVYGDNDTPHAAAIVGHESWLTDPDPIIRSAAIDAFRAGPNRERTKQLSAAWKQAQSDRTPDAAVSVLGALVYLAQGPNALPADQALLTELARQGLLDPRLAVRREAAAVLYTTNHEKHPAELYGVETGRSAADYTRLAQRMLQWPTTTKLIMKTNKGDVTLTVSHINAPLTTDNFLRLVSAGFYDGLLFHRVVPGFVAQGGDPQGTGWSGPGYEIRDEENLPFETGTLGMASAGHDTAGSQFFITVTPTPHLDGRYTAFGWVNGSLDAMAVVENLIPGDRILSLTITH